MFEHQGRCTMKMFLLMIATAFLALAQNPHFSQANASLAGDGTLTLSWKEAGLGQNTSVDYTASATQTATYGCINKGDKHPKASNKETVTQPVTATATFSSGKNGMISGSMVIDILPPPTDFSCPGNMRLVLVSVAYTDVQLKDVTNNILADIPTAFAFVVYP